MSPATTTPVWLTSESAIVHTRRWVAVSIATRVEAVVVAEGETTALAAGDADLPGDALVEAVAVAEGVGELDAATDSSPPPSTNTTVPSTTAAGDDGPRDRGALQSTPPSVRSTASTDCRPTTIASPSATTGAGIPAAWLASPMSVAADHATRYGGDGASVATPVLAAVPWYWPHD